MLSYRYLHTKNRYVVEFDFNYSPTLHLVLNLFCYQGSTMHLKKILMAFFRVQNDDYTHRQTAQPPETH